MVFLCREILNEDRCPGFLLEAVRSIIKKRRKLIKAKMLGNAVSERSSRSHTHQTLVICRSKKNCSEQNSLFPPSDEEETPSLFGNTEVDGTRPGGADKPESRIRNL